MNSQTNIESYKTSLCELAKTLEVLNFEDKMIINPKPIRIQNNEFSTEKIFENYYDTYSKTLDIDSFVYDFSSYIELQLCLKLNNVPTEIDDSSEYDTDNQPECPFCD